MRTLVALFALVALVAVACGGGASPSPTSAASAAASEAAPSPSAAASEEMSASPSGEASAGASAEASGSAAAGDVTVMTAESDLGEILVDGEGMTLYMFEPDEAGEPTCYDQCAEAWPPLLAEGEITVGEGLDDSDFSTATRTDGGDQVKVGDWPLYYFANDEAPGDTNGQGVNEVWFVVGADGEPIRE